MVSPEEEPPSETTSREAFPPTRWSLITRSRDHDETKAAVAMQELCQRYWYPIYAFVRQKGHGRQDAEDLTQGFFHSLLAKESFQAAQAERGRLRTFLLGSLDHFLVDVHRFRQALKRGGDRQLVSFDVLEAQERYGHEPQAHATNPASLFDRAWATDLLDRAFAETRRRYEERGKAPVFDGLKDYLGWKEKEVPYRDLATELGMREGALRVNIFRLRQRFRTVLEQEIAETVGSLDEVQGELDYLHKITATTQTW